MAEPLFMDKAAFEKQLEEETEWIERNIKGFLPEGITLQKTVYNAMEYSIMAGGKRLRPMFMWEAYKMSGGEDRSVVLPFMAAIEMIHTYSLVHDDLPAMDNDEYRRGIKTTHIVYGEDMGILAGDALLNYAFETALSCFNNDNGMDTMLKARALKILANKSGIYGMLGGQVVDVEKTGQALSNEELDFIYSLKTGALIEAAFMAGAVLAGADSNIVEAFEKAGHCIGMAFQIQDDILDITSTPEELGKPVHSDERNEKSTYVAVYGMDNALKAVKEYSGQALGILSNMPVQNSYLNTLARMLINRKK